MHRRFCPSNARILQSKQSTSSYTNFPFQRQSQNSWVACSHMLAQIVWPFTKLYTHISSFSLWLSLQKCFCKSVPCLYTWSLLNVGLKQIRLQCCFHYSPIRLPTHTILFLISFACVQKSEQTVLSYRIKTFPFPMLWTQCPSTTCPLFLSRTLMKCFFNTS